MFLQWNCSKYLVLGGRYGIQKKKKKIVYEVKHSLFFFFAKPVHFRGKKVIDVLRNQSMLFDFVVVSHTYGHLRRKTFKDSFLFFAFRIFMRRLFFSVCVREYELSILVVHCPSLYL